MTQEGVLQKGLVYKSTGSWYLVKDESGVFRNARLKGKMKTDDEISSSNPIAVGDYVSYRIEDTADESGIISGVEPRNNYIIRVSPQNRNQKHIIAANLDVAVVMATIASPRTSSGFIDRFLITAEAYHIKTIIVINKIDILKGKHAEQLAYWQDMYGKAGYEVYPIVALDPSTTNVLRERLKGKISLFSGHSGVGKSTLINKLVPERIQKTQVVSEWSGKGQHTTTFAEMFDLPDGGAIIDTPGVKEFGLIDFEKEELAQYFPEMRAVMSQCRFNNCLHINEPGCAVKDGVLKNTISSERYFSYCSILETLKDKW